jgi:hypothetical protein
MMLYVGALVVLGVAVAGFYTVYGHPADPETKPASETILNAPAN